MHTVNEKNQIKMASTSGKKGSDSKDDTSQFPVKTSYKCVVKNCDKSMRGDKIKDHFEKTSNLSILDKAKN